MKYETPEMTMLTPAINAIQSGIPQKTANDVYDGGQSYEATSSYADWE